MSEYQVVISFRQDSEHAAAADWREWWTWRMRHIAESGQKVTIDDLDVAVREIGAGGETLEHEGVWPEGSLRTDDVQVADVRPTDTVDSKGLL